jgi:hypothetical protein
VILNERVASSMHRIDSTSYGKIRHKSTMNKNTNLWQRGRKKERFWLTVKTTFYCDAFLLYSNRERLEKLSRHSLDDRITKNRRRIRILLRRKPQRLYLCAWEWSCKSVVCSFKHCCEIALVAPNKNEKTYTTCSLCIYARVLFLAGKRTINRDLLFEKSSKSEKSAIHRQNHENRWLIARSAKIVTKSRLITDSGVFCD